MLLPLYILDVLSDVCCLSASVHEISYNRIIMHVLVVEKDRPSCEKIVTLLEGLGVASIVALDPIEAILSAKANRPVAIVLSADLGSSSGYALCSKFKRDPDLQAIPVLIIAEDADPDTFLRHQQLKTGAQVYLHGARIQEQLGPALLQYLPNLNAQMEIPTMHDTRKQDGIQSELDQLLRHMEESHEDGHMAPILPLPDEFHAIVREAMVSQPDMTTSAETDERQLRLALESVQSDLVFASHERAELEQEVARLKEENTVLTSQRDMVRDAIRHVLEVVKNIK